MKSNRHSICCDPVKRTWTNTARDKDGQLVTFEEIVYQHDIYQTKGGKLWWRGARLRR